MIKYLHRILIACILLSLAPLYAIAPTTIVGTVDDPDSYLSMSNATGIALAPNGTAYVTNKITSEVAIIDTATNTVIGEVNDSYIAFNSPTLVAVLPGGATAYVVNAAFEAVFISVIDVSSNTVIGEVTNGIGTFGTLTSIAFDTINQTCYIVAPAQGIWEINLLSNAVTALVSNSNIPTSVAVSLTKPDVYATEELTHDVIAFTTTPSPIFTDLEPSFIAISPDGFTAYVAASLISGNSVVDVLDLPYNTTNGTVSNYTSTTLNTITFAPDGSIAYLVNQNTVDLVNTANNTDIGLLSDPDNLLSTSTFLEQVVVDPSGRFGYLTDQSGTVYVLGFVTSATILPPSSVSGCKTQNVFLLQTDFINNITWTAPTTGEAPAQYRIYRDPALTDLVATVSAAGTLQYYDHNRQPNVVYSYYIVSVAADGTPSTTANSVTVTQLCS